MATSSRPLRWWSVVHAVLLLAATLTTVLTDTVTPLLLTATITFTGLFGIGFSTPSARAVSLPNGVTAIRFLSIAGLVWLTVTNAVSGYLLALGAIGLLLSDALDGWLARRYESMTGLGALFDEEVDAFFLLALCTAAAATDRLGWWILIPGLMRYGFVLVRPLLDRQNASAKIRSKRARLLFVVMMGAMISTLLPIPALYVPATIGASGLLGISFLIDTWNLLTARSSHFTKLKNCGRKLLLTIRGHRLED